MGKFLWKSSVGMMLFVQKKNISVIEFCWGTVDLAVNTMLISNRGASSVWPLGKKRDLAIFH